MPETPIYKYETHVVNSDAITLSSIVRNPRIYKPQDLLAACQNTTITCSDPQAPPAVSAVVNYLLAGFFVYAHRTGLYNRQRTLWESLSKVVAVSAYQLKSGFLRRTPLPILDLHLCDYRERMLVLARLIEPGFSAREREYEKLLNSFLDKAQRSSGLAGLFFCCPAPVPGILLNKVAKLTGALDPVARYESVLPAPWSVPLDLIEISMESGSGGSTPGSQPLRLVHPNLSSTRRIRAAVIDQPGSGALNLQAG